MNKKLLFVLSLLTIGLVGAPTGLSTYCRDGRYDDGICAPGRVLFTGYNYPDSVHVNVVRDSDGTVYDDWDYNTSEEGRLRFEETLIPGGSYTITLTATGLNTTLTVTTGPSQ